MNSVHLRPRSRVQISLFSIFVPGYFNKIVCVFFSLIVILPADSKDKKFFPSNASMITSFLPFRPVLSSHAFEGEDLRSQLTQWYNKGKLGRFHRLTIFFVSFLLLYYIYIHITRLVTFYENDRNVDTITSSVSRLQNSIDFAFPSDGNKPTYDYLNSVRLTFPRERK